jgi:hypothetical protein
MEFILEGDPTTGVSANLAVGTNSTSFVRYEVWGSSDQIGFTQGGIADYVFTPAVASPTQTTHITYLWNTATLTMKLYLNGVLAGVVTNVDSAFSLPVSQGRLGANLDNTEPMTGTIHRVTVYEDLLQESVILSHGSVFAGQAPAIGLNVAGGVATVVISQGIPGAHYRVEYRNSLSAGDTWELLQDIPALAGTTASVPDPTPIASRSYRYYRTVLVH